MTLYSTAGSTAVLLSCVFQPLLCPLDVGGLGSLRTSTEDQEPPDAHSCELHVEPVGKGLPALTVLVDAELNLQRPHDCSL